MCFLFGYLLFFVVFVFGALGITNIERLQQTTCCICCNLETGLLILFALHIIGGILGIVAGILAFGYTNGGVIAGGVFALISGLVSFQTG